MKSDQLRLSRGNPPRERDPADPDRRPIEFSPDDSTENAFADTDEHDRLDLAQDWLRTQLRDGRRPSADLKRCARQAGISLRALGVTASRTH